MFKSLHNKQLISLTVLTAALGSMTLATAPAVAQQESYDEPNYSLVGSTRNEAMTGAGSGQVELFSTKELEDLVAPVALYPDELLAIVLPAAAYPLQIVQAARFLEELENDDSLQPDEAWDESVVALLNYPEVIELLNDDLEWTWRLGEAVLNQESEIIAAVEAFRDRAMLAGNLKTDERQIINTEGGTIEITPSDPEVIYVPYYEPERVVVYQPYPVYHYYPSPYPVYYYPYPVGHHFASGFFWGITTAFTIGWHSNHLSVHLWNYYSHPYYGHTYYRRNHYYHRPSHHDRRHRQAGGGRHDGDRWRPGRGHGARPGYRGPDHNRHSDNRVVATSGSSRFQQSDTFRPRPGFQDRMISANNAVSGDAARNTRSEPPVVKRDTQYDKTRAYKTTPKKVAGAKKQPTLGKSGRSRLDWEKDRRVISREPVAQNKSKGNRFNRSAKSKDSIKKPTAPSNQDRYVSGSDRSYTGRTSRPNPVSANQSRGRVTNPVAYSGGREARPSPLPRQSQRPASRAMESRPAPAASKPSPPPKSNRGRGKSKGSNVKARREDRVRRK